MVFLNFKQYLICQHFTSYNFLIFKYLSLSLLFILKNNQPTKTKQKTKPNQPTKPHQPVCNIK